MPTFLDGSQNLAALTVPGLYVDVILPTPFLAGTPTNIVGIVGVGSWGPTNSLIPISNPTDCALSLGWPQIRTYDIATHVAAATQVGGSIGFLAVRVTDGTDAAATATVGTGGTYASGTLTFSGNPTAGDLITIAGTTITFVSAAIGSTLAKTLATLLLELQNSNDTNLKTCTYGVVGSVLTVTYGTVGVGGNAITLAKTSSVITLSGATLAGGAGSGGTGVTLTGKYTGTLGNSIQFSIQNGTLANSYMAVVSFPGLAPEQFNNITGSGNTFWVNLANTINSGNAYSSPSKFIVASAGAATAAPTLSTITSLSGGTDGASGVTDATLMGQDVLPRKGMYVLRSSAVSDFTLIDMTTIANWAAISSFALAENMFPVLSSPSGASYTTTIANRISAGIDSPWAWLVGGDYPTFYDAYNGVSRLVNPTAFALGRLGNLSPQNSPLNKPLTGITSTQTSALGQTYSDTDLSLINQGGIDVILPSTQSPGGYFYSFATGRNASSNTAANGVEYTRMTNFLARTAQSQAAGSFIGRTQSIQPNDQTRSDAKSLFDGLSAFLASPQVGMGIGGQGIIDTPWQVICDTTNNTPDTIARGYLFLYWKVRYLGIVRYFVVKFAGGGNVTVSVQTSV